MFDVEEYIIKEFIREFANRGVRIDGHSIRNAKKQFDIDAVERYIIEDIDAASRKNRYNRALQYREIDRITNSHKKKIREIVKQYVYIISSHRSIAGGGVSPPIITESNARRAKTELKASRQAGCDIYPC
ncbi:hypothetical protein [Alloalcanivorax gelatiniphagus]|uniref:Uncharacterized protein n=1 Tax=Alloalcanivorax gelatiniphagus TaxID=1194167 RepID=A0ABY2XQR5_9GAMM|nr:hypothetical protein [Alloalcanivorax gelatiniphagus]TMW14584.1 hypothetical protein FGS76_01980 [Alloalcanivorax gelatiniphagus]